MKPTYLEFCVKSYPFFQYHQLNVVSQKRQGLIPQDVCFQLVQTLARCYRALLHLLLIALLCTAG